MKEVEPEKQASPGWVWDGWGPLLGSGSEGCEGCEAVKVEKPSVMGLLPEQGLVIDLGFKCYKMLMFLLP